MSEHNSQEYIQSEETTDVQGNPINIGAKISTGSYVGNGAVGANYPNSLTFEFEPKVVFIAPEGNITNYCIPYVWGANYMVSFEGASLDAGHNHVSVSGNTMTWYVQQGRQTDDTQLNNMGTTYKYVAIGQKGGHTMLIIEIAALENGAHHSQIDTFLYF